MNQRPREDVIDRVRKLLIQTEADGCTLAEAETAFRLASRIMAEHNIDMAECEVREGEREHEWLEGAAGESGRWTLPQQYAYAIVCDFFFVQGFFRAKYVPFKDRDGYIDTKTVKILMFFGRADNVEAARFTFAALLEAFDRLFAEYRARTKAPASDRRIFVTGVADGFRGKLKAEREAVEVERDILSGRAGGTSIVLASVADKTRAKFREAHPEYNKNGKVRYAEVRGDTSALEAGREAGRKLSLNRQVGQSSSKALPGS